MRDIYAKLQHWHSLGHRTALATVVKTWRSSPRQAGSSMIVSDQMEIYGSVSGGCVEGAVAKEALQTINDGKSRMLSFGVSNEEAWEVGLSCGGGIKVLVRPFDPTKGISSSLNAALAEVMASDGAISMIEPVDGSTNLSGWCSDESHQYPTEWSPQLNEQVEAIHASGQSAMLRDNGIDYFCHVVAGKRQLLIIGAAHITVDLLKMGIQLDFSPRVIDPRGLFTKSIKGLCPGDRLHRAWPADILPNLPLDQNYYSVLLTHDPKIDDQALHILLASDVKYIGALGSRKTHARRLERLSQAGFTPAQTDRIHGPVGMEVGANTPAEIALSIVAEMTAVSNSVSLT